MKTINLLDVILKDDETDCGGTSYWNEDLRNFLDETGTDYNTDLELVNGVLIDNGILPITKENYNI